MPAPPVLSHLPVLLVYEYCRKRKVVAHEEPVALKMMAPLFTRQPVLEYIPYQIPFA